MKLKELLNLLKNAKETGDNKYIACCPSHDDNNPSLAIMLSRDGKRIILKCFAGCSESNVLNSLGLEKSDLYINSDTNQCKPTVTEKHPYKYTDEKGNLLYTKTRLDYSDGTKSFYFEQPNGTKGVKGIDRVVYNLASFKDASTIYFVEGEKCADALISRGRVATTLDNGANSRWHKHYDKYFMDKEVIIIPDNDDAGKQYANRVNNKIINSKIINLPDLPPKGDIYDWLNSGHTVDELDLLPMESDSADKSTKTIKVETEAETILRLVKENRTFLFHDTMNNLYASLVRGDHNEVWSIESKDFAIWLNKLYYCYKGKPARKDSINQALSVLSAQALFDNDEAIPLSNRVAKHEDAFWYSLSNTKWQAVKITGDGWSVENNPPILFTQYRHQIPQIEPTSNGDVNKIFKYINIKENKTLFLCWLISCFVPDIPHAMPIFHGEKGAAKSTTCTLLKRLIDPSALETLTLQSDSRSMAINLQQHWFLPFDNVSAISVETSDTLCRAITGGGIQQRKLYSDADDYIFTFKRCLALNGINNVATRPDLLDRAILIELRRIPEENRQELSEIQRNFEKDLPSILGGIFDILSKAIKMYPSVKLSNLPRMADFARWCYVIGQALGGLGDDFILEYRLNYDCQNIEILNSDIVAVLMVAFMKEKSEWEGTMSELLNEISFLAPIKGISTKTKGFPAYPNVLSRRLNGIKSNLKSAGISYKTIAKSDATYITINNEKISPLPEYRLKVTELLGTNHGDNQLVSPDNGDTDDDIVSF